MQLISSPASPFSRVVMVLLQETRQTQDVEILPVTTTPTATDAQVRAANPLGKIPALIRDDGPTLYDSRVICRFLDSRAGAGLYPPERIWEVLTLEATAHGIMEAAVLMVYEHRLRPPEKVFDPLIEAQWDKITRAVAAVNARWMSHLNGPLDISHVAMGCALGYLDLRHADRSWRKGNDALDDWFAVFAERPAMTATAPQ